MTTVQPRVANPPADRHTGIEQTVLVRAGDGLVLHRVRRRDEVFARLRRRALDNRLSAGVPAEDALMLAIRAHQLVRPGHRRRLARAWDEVGARAAAPLRLFDVRVPVDRRRLAAAAAEIDDVSAVLRSDRAVSARGVAIAGGLLTSARSPLYRRGGSAADLVAAVGRALTEF